MYELRMTLQDRIDSYAQSRFPACLMIQNERLYGTWIVGNRYAAPHGFYGEYPPSFLERVYALFPDCPRVLHLFSGALPAEERGVRVDFNPELLPDVVADAKTIGNLFEKDSFDLAIADPPYSPKDAKKYGAKPFLKWRVVSDLTKVVRPGGFLVWLDLMTPIFSKHEWTWVGLITLWTGTNRKVRAVSIFQKRSE